jgi:8-oxo-dGTP pyrophosphatase MutT (NUDIX family)
MKNATLCLLVDQSAKRILLGLKKRGFGKDKYNGFGGKPKQGESIEQAAVRELSEEISVGVTQMDLAKVGELTFVFPSVPQEELSEDEQWDQLVHVFLVRKWKGTPKETEEMKPVWFPFNGIPFDRMWQDDSHWLPLVLQGKKVKATFVFGSDNESIEKMDLKQLEQSEQSGKLFYPPKTV